MRDKRSNIRKPLKRRRGGLDIIVVGLLVSNVMGLVALNNYVDRMNDPDFASSGLGPLNTSSTAFALRDPELPEPKFNGSDYALPQLRDNLARLDTGSSITPPKPAVEIASDSDMAPTEAAHAVDTAPTTAKATSRQSRKASVRLSMNKPAVRVSALPANRGIAHDQSSHDDFYSAFASSVGTAPSVEAAPFTAAAPASDAQLAVSPEDPIAAIASQSDLGKAQLGQDLLSAPIPPSDQTSVQAGGHANSPNDSAAEATSELAPTDAAMGNTELLELPVLELSDLQIDWDA